MKAGQHLDAQACCQQALAADPAHTDALHLQGLLSLAAQQPAHAVEWIARAIRQDPKPEYLASLGQALLQQGRPDDALKAFDKAVQLKPDDAGLWMKFGNALLELKRSEEAILSFQHVLALDAQAWEAAYLSGFLLHELGRSDEALVQLNRADALKPDRAEILEARADALHRLKNNEAALADNMRAHALNPRNANTCNNIGAVLQSLSKDEEALPWFDRAVALRPDHVVALINKASSLQQLRRFDEAVAVYHHVAVIDPASTEPEWNLSFLALLKGDFEAGWAGREVRWRRPHGYPNLSVPMWLGNEPLQGKTILVVSDEGLGDVIQFARYVPKLAGLGARVVVLVQEPLRLMMSELPGVSEAFGPAQAGAIMGVDFHCPVMSLPLAVKTTLETIPAPAADWPRPSESRVQAWQNRLGAREGPRVGLVWSGQAGHKNDHNRSLPLRLLTRILNLDATFVSLQKDPRPADQAILRKRTDIIDLTAELTDLCETAALIACLDLVITVDTGVAHLAATLGCPTWILLPYSPDYRWLLDRDDSPWYPAVKLFRQTATRDYGEVLDRVRAELEALISTQP